MKKSLAAMVAASVILTTLSGCGSVQVENGTTGVSEELNTWVCGDCGATGNTGKFCTECGAEKKSAEPVSTGSWVCSQCGATSTGKFCTECGSPRDRENTESAIDETSTVTTQTKVNSEQTEMNGETTASIPSHTETDLIQTEPINSEVVSTSNGTIGNPFKMENGFIVRDTMQL